MSLMIKFSGLLLMFLSSQLEFALLPEHPFDRLQFLPGYFSQVKSGGGAIATVYYFVASNSRIFNQRD